MRITNKIISNNSVTNINNNKVYEDKLNTQLATGSKINRPSDDPVVAIRALRLRTNLNQVNQFYSKNIPDAESWLDVTESAISTVVDIVTDMIGNCTKGSVGFDTTEDRDKVLQNLKALQEEVYATGDADYAGRFVFSGYRTDTSVTFGQSSEQTYSITAQLDSSAVDEITYVDTQDLEKLTEASAVGMGTVQQDVTNNTIHRLRLPYDECSMTVPPTITYFEGGSQTSLTGIQTVSINDATQDPYLIPANDDDAIVYIPETGELILGKNAYDKLMATKDIPGTDPDEGEILVSFQKEKFEAKDIRPEHFYKCESNGIEYNEGFVGYYNADGDWVKPSETDNSNQFISYDVGFNQTVRVNTLASELFSTNISRDIDDLVHSIEDVDAIEKTISTLDKMLKEDPENEDLKDRMEAAQKASTFLNDKMQKLFEHSITKMQDHLGKANKALTATGNRGSRVELVANRLSKQQVNFKELASDNEDIDLTEVAVQLSSVELAYQASLMATGKISQTTLLNYI